MSRRHVSVKDLGAVDCQGWLHRKKEGRRFLGSRWKRYWFALKKCSLYWYTDNTAEEAEGFIKLSGFTVEQAKQCRRKHAITVSHPTLVTIFIAAESFKEMNKWIGKLSEAAELCEVTESEECYSESSNQDECASTCSQDSEQETAESEHGDVVQPPCESPCSSLPPATAAGDTSRSNLQEGTGSRDRRADPEAPENLSQMDFPRLDGAIGATSTIQVTEEEDVLKETPSDELESLYNHLKAASLCPIGQRDFRASFVRRCQNDKINEKLHLVRIFRSTLKAKESVLQVVEQVLGDPTLTAPTYRSWRLSNPNLLQEISQHKPAAGGAAGPGPPEPPSS